MFLQIESTNTKNQNNLKGFTLVELLVTVAIVGLLAGMAISQFEEYRIKAYDAISISTLENARTAFEAYQSDNVQSPLESFTFSNTQGMNQSYCLYAVKGSNTELGCNFTDLLPGLNISEETYLYFAFNSTIGNPQGTIITCHCRGSKTTHAFYQNYPAIFRYTYDDGITYLDISFPCLNISCP